MQEQHFNELTDQMVTQLLPLVPADEAGAVKQKVTQAINRLTDENKLMSLPEDEYKLLLAYRLWKASSGVATGSFIGGNRDHHRNSRIPKADAG